jgi:hypothetical protein
MLRGLHTIKTAKNPSKSLWWLNKKWISSTNCHTTTGLQETLCQVNRMMTLYLGCWWFAEIKLVWQLTVCGKSFGHPLVSQLRKCQYWPKPLIICPKPSQHVWVTSPMEKIPWECGGVRTPYLMFEGGNLLNLNLTPVINIPWKP